MNKPNNEVAFLLSILEAISDQQNIYACFSWEVEQI